MGLREMELGDKEWINVVRDRDKMDLREIGWRGMEWINLIQDRDEMGP
jgi:hypothetical protein